MKKLISGVATAAALLIAAPVKAERRPDISCQDTVEQIAGEMKAKGTSVRSAVVSVNDNQFYNLALQGTGYIQYTVGNISYGSKSNSIGSNIMNSEVLLQSYSKRIFSACRGTGRISFGLNASDWIAEFAYTSAGSLLKEVCSHDRNDPMLERAASYVDHPNGPSLKGSCALMHASMP